MMYERMGMEDLMTAVKTHVKERTGKECYDFEKQGLSKPFYLAEVVKSISNNTKTMYTDIFTVQIQCIPETEDSTAEIYGMIKDLQETLTEEITLPEPWELILQTENGIQSMKTEDTKEQKPVVQYEFMVCYGFTCKQ